MRGSSAQVILFSRRADVVIEDAQADNIIQRIPQWHRQVISAKRFLLPTRTELRHKRSSHDRHAFFKRTPVVEGL
jgi:hypothetical protein